MTALAAYERLEAEGRFAPRPGDPEREVLVKFGDASLMIMTFDETPIDHWPLASLSRVIEGGAALTLAPDAGAEDRLRLDDPAMVAAILEVCDALSAAPPSPLRSLRRPALRAAALAALAGLAWQAWSALPAALDRLADGLPVAARAALGDAAVAGWPEGRACDSPEAARALAALSTRLSRGLGGAPVAIQVIEAAAPLLTAASRAPSPPAVAPPDARDAAAELSTAQPATPLPASSPPGAAARVAAPPSPVPPAPDAFPTVRALAAPGGRVALFFAALEAASAPIAVAEAAAAALAGVSDAALTRAAVRESGLLGAVAVFRGEFAAPRLAAAARRAMAQTPPPDPAATRALLEAAGLADPAAAAATIGPAGWRALRAVCDR